MAAKAEKVAILSYGTEDASASISEMLVHGA
jgi:hypothetical protein